MLDLRPKDSGGTRTDVLTSQAFEAKLQELAAILKSQHRVVYARPQTLIPPEKIEVSVGEARRCRGRRPRSRTGAAGNVMRLALCLARRRVAVSSRSRSIRRSLGEGGSSAEPAARRLKRRSRRSRRCFAPASSWCR